MASLTLQIQTTPLSEDALAWYRQQPPTVIADALNIGRTALITPTHASETALHAQHAAELQRLNAAHQESRHQQELLTDRERETHQHRLQLMQMELESTQQLVAQLRTHRQEHDQMMLEEHKRIAKELYDAELQRKDIEIQRLKEHATQAAARADASTEFYATRIEPLLSQHNQMFSTTVAKGIAGENLTRNVFDQLDLGCLEDTRHDRAVGTEDFRWTNTDGLRCNVEVKFVENINNVHDMRKHITRTQEASQSGQINAALFLSLRCKIPNMSAIALKQVAGIPVLYVSGGNMTPVQVVQVGFRILAQLWPVLRNSKYDTEADPRSFERLSLSVTQLVATQLNALATANKHIEDVESHANSILRTASRMRRLRQEQLDTITNLQTAHEIWPEPPKAGSSTTFAHAEQAVRYYYATNSRYPKTEAQLGLTLPASIDLDDVVRRVKGEIARERRGAENRQPKRAAITPTLPTANDAQPDIAKTALVRMSDDEHHTTERAAELREHKKQKRADQPPPDDVEYDPFTKTVLAGIGSSSPEDDDDDHY